MVLLPEKVERIKLIGARRAQQQETALAKCGKNGGDGGPASTATAAVLSGHGLISLESEPTRLHVNLGRIHFFAGRKGL
jgi:hypothetical protein